MNSETDTDFRNLGGALLEASDTSSALIQIIVLILVAYPDAQRKGQQEIDDVIGNDRPPTWDDLPKLPYLAAFIEEVKFNYIVVKACFLIVGSSLSPHCTLRSSPCYGKGRGGACVSISKSYSTQLHIID